MGLGVIEQGLGLPMHVPVIEAVDAIKACLFRNAKAKLVNLVGRQFERTIQVSSAERGCFHALKRFLRGVTKRHRKFLGQARFRLAQLASVSGTERVCLLSQAQRLVYLGQGERVAVVELGLQGAFACFPLIADPTFPGADVVQHFARGLLGDGPSDAVAEVLFANQHSHLVPGEEQFGKPSPVGAGKISLSDGLHGADPVLVVVNDIAR